MRKKLTCPVISVRLATEALSTSMSLPSAKSAVCLNVPSVNSGTSLGALSGTHFAIGHATDAITGLQERVPDKSRSCR